MWTKSTERSDIALAGRQCASGGLIIRRGLLHRRFSVTAFHRFSGFSIHAETMTESEAR